MHRFISNSLKNPRRVWIYTPYEDFYSDHDYLGWGETLATGLIALMGKASKED